MSSNFSQSALQTPPPVCLVNASLYPPIFGCLSDITNSNQVIALTFTNALLILPLSTLLFCKGVQERRGKSPAGDQTSHTDIFTYYMAAVDLSYVLGLLFYYFTLHVCKLKLMVAAYYSIFYSNSVLTFFHTLTCVERYLAVVHPVTYMKLRRATGERVRDASISFVFLLAIAMLGYGVYLYPVFPSNLYFCTLGFISLVVSSCSFAIFRVLRRPGVGRDESKRRAFQIVMAITAVLLFRFLGQCCAISLLDKWRNNSGSCAFFLSASWMCLPSSLVLPLLYLQRRGALTLKCLYRANWG